METVSFSAPELARRRHLCADFKSRLRAIKLRIGRFAELSGASRAAAYSWSSQGKDCVPPPPLALRVLLLLELLPEARLILETEAQRDKSLP